MSSLSVKHKKKVFWSAFFLLISLLFQSEIFPVQPLLTGDSIKVDTVIIRGNLITEPQIIYHEMTFKAGDMVTPKILDYNRERIFSLGLFSSVKVIPDSFNNAAIIVQVEESWYWWPIPIVELKDQDWNKLSYGLDFTVLNFRGLNQRLHFKFTAGYDPAIAINYENPSLDSEGRYYFGTSFSKGEINNRSDSAKIRVGNNFSYKYYNTSISSGKRFDLNTIVYILFGYQYFEYPYSSKDVNFKSLSPKGYPYFVLEYTLNTRDLTQNAEQGISALLHLEHKGFDVHNIAYQYLRVDLIKYFPLWSKLVLKTRVSTGQVWGARIPYYDLQYLGSTQRIRGRYNVSTEGKGLYFSSAEIKWTLIKERLISLDLPLIPTTLTKYRTGLYLYSFIDYGSIHESAFSFERGASQTGFGGGVAILILPYNQVRFELGMSKTLKPSFMVDIGTSF